MPLKAKLKVVLFANELPVAESTDEGLWQQILAKLTKPSAQPAEHSDPLGSFFQFPIEKKEPIKSVPLNALANFCKELNVSEDIVSGACGPTAEPPFLRLDMHCWESFKRNTPPRGSNAISGMQLAGTLAALWFKHAELGYPSQKNAKDILDTIGVLDKNPSRAISNCKWLQSRGREGIRINPSEIRQAILIARTYCTKQPLDTKSQKKEFKFEEQQ
jgi:hypothetical protein